MTAADGDLFALGDIARLANARPSAVSNWRRRYEDFPTEVKRDGKLVLFDREDVLRWLERHRPDARAADSGRLPALKEMRAIASHNDLSEVALALVCLTALAPEDVSSIAWNLPRAAQTRRIADLSEAVESELEMPDLFLALRERPPGVDEASLAHRLTAAFGLIAGPDVGPPPRDVAVDMFEYLLQQRNRARSRRSAETRSADWLADLMVNLAAADRGRVLDPAAGEAGFLLAAGRAATEPVQLIGWELDAATVRLARQRLLIHGLPARIEQADSLAATVLQSLRADAVICAPPLGQRERPERWSAADPRWVYGLPAPHAELAWVQLALFHLAPGGRAAILTGHGPLSRSAYEARIRAQLLQAGAIEAIIALPAGSALHTGAPLALWLLRTPGSNGRDGRVLFIDAGARPHPGDAPHRSERPEVSSDPAALATLAGPIEDTVRAWRANPATAELVAGFAAAHPSDDLVAGDANLTPARLVQRPASRQEIAQAIRTSLAHHAQIHSQLCALPEPRLPDLANAPDRRSLKLGELLHTGRMELIRGRRNDPQTDSRGVPVLGPWSFRGEGPRYADLGATHPRLQPGDIIVTPHGHGFRALVCDLPDAALEAPVQALRLTPPRPDDDAYLDPTLVAEVINIQKLDATGTTGRHSVTNIELPVLDRTAGEELAHLLAGLRREAELHQQAAEVRARLRELLITALTD